MVDYYQGVKKEPEIMGQPNIYIYIYKLIILVVLEYNNIIVIIIITEYMFSYDIEISNGSYLSITKCLKALSEIFSM